MTRQEAINQLEFDKHMIALDTDTMEEMPPEVLKRRNEENYRTYQADELAIKALKTVQALEERGFGIEVLENYMIFEDICIQRGYAFRELLEVLDKGQRARKGQSEKGDGIDGKGNVRGLR